MKKIYFKSNLKHLINIYGDTNLDLALYLDYSSASAISNMINRSNNDYPSDPQIIDKICIRYKITKEMLLYEDLSNIKTAYLFEIDEKKQIEFCSYIFPIISPKNNDSENFKKAFKIHSNLMKQTSPKFDVSQDFLTLSNLYLQAFETSNSLSSLANLLSLLIYSRATIDKENLIDGYQKFKNNIITGKTFKKDYILDNQISLSKSAESNDLDDFILECIRILKKHNDYQSFADFYLAIRYFLNIAQEDLDPATSASISGLLLSDLVCLHNKYAINFFVYKQELEEKEIMCSQTVKEK